MSRPPSARPKTSAGRAVSARQRPQSRSQAVANGPAALPIASRPESRSSMSRGPIMEQPRMASRSGLPAPRPNTGVRAELADRPLTTGIRPLSSAQRPITQQGLAGARAVSRLGTASQRQVFDKSYYMGVLKAKLAALNHEIVRLDGVAAKGEKDRAEMSTYEKRAEESALEIKELQGKLADYNMVIERMHTANAELSDIELEAKEVRKKADEIAASVEELYAERRSREAQVERVLGEIEEQKKLNQAVIASMDINIRERYEECQRAAAALKAGLEADENELNQLEKQRIALEQELHASPLKQKASELRERLLELNEKEAALLKERDEAETPEQKKTKLLEQVKKNNEEIVVMQKQLQQVNEQIEQSNEELQEFDNEIDVLTGEQNERYIELKRKEQQMTEFLANFEDQKRLATLEMEELSEAIVQNLQRIASNISKVNMADQVTGIDPAGDRGEYANASASELKQVHVRLQDELLALNELETSTREEIDQMEQKISEAEAQIEKLGDGEQLRREVEAQLTDLQERKGFLEQEVPEEEGALVEATNQLEGARSRLERSDAYRMLLNAHKNLAHVAKETVVQRRAYAIHQYDTNFEPIKQQVLQMQKEYNQHLVAQAMKPAKPVYQSTL